MAFVQFSKVSLAFGNRDILKDVSINLAEGSRVALAGANGCGKSTLMKVLAGIQEYDSGDRAVEKGTRIVYVPQSGIVHKGTTLRAEIDKAFSLGYKMNKKAEEIGERLKDTSLNNKTQQYLIEEHATILTFLDESSWHRRDVLAEQTLLGLGFIKQDLDRKCEEFSGGWQMRIALAKALLQNPDILLLDEPTNYLDIEARTWLEEFLISFKGGFLLVSHDRYFLDITVNEVCELFNGELHRYPGNYSHYEKVRQQELESLMHRYELQQVEIKKLEDFINRFRYKATKSAQAMERQKQLDKIERIQIPEALKKIHFSFPPAPHSGKIVMTAENLGKSYVNENGQKNEVIKHLDFLIEKGDRLVVVGRNGAGKSTLLRILATVDNNYTGTIKPGAGVQIGYFSQDNAETISGDISIIDKLEQSASLDLMPKLRDMLGAFLFRGDDVYKSLNVLSGGEKSRVALLQLLLRPVNLLILDEPTNHLDMHSKDVLLDALADFNGTIIFVSHDRGFIENLANRVLELKPGQSREFVGDYEYYLQRLEAESKVDGVSFAFGSTNSDNKKTEKTHAEQIEKSEGALSYEEEKRIKAERRKLEKKQEHFMDNIVQKEEQKAAQENLLATPEVYSDGVKSAKTQKNIDALEKKIGELTEAWEKTSEELEEYACADIT
ncbi:MAG TPA: ABC-F family ATP-binding cassette domain-containing protein [Treponemataceae bacterium]|nr:ABC-F family ATP-binding cassette domain-containing protein [Treponemataceae bacterium]